MNPTHKSISIVSPVYKAENIIDELVKRISQEVSAITDNYEIILIEDGGDDGSWQKIEHNCRKNSRVKGIKLSRNFGQHFAITAGLNNASGDYVAVMDCDLQDNPKYIPKMIQLVDEGYDIVFTKKIYREHNLFKNLTAKLFYFIFNWLSDNQQATKDVGGFSLLSRQVVDAFNNIRDYRRHYLMVLRWLGFKYTYLEIEHERRYSGKSSYSIPNLIRLAIDGITSQSDKLLRISISVGFLFFAMALMFSVYLIYSLLESGALPGWTSLMVAVSVSTGFILVAIGILGIYIGKIFEQTKERPLYIIHKRINF